MTRTKNIKDEKKSFLSLTGRQATGWAGFILFAFVVVFFTGTLVGRGSVRIDLGQKKLAQEIDDYAKKMEKLKNAEVEMIDETPDLVFYETLQKKEQQDKVKKPEKKAPDRIPRKKKSVVKKLKESGNIALVSEAGKKVQAVSVKAEAADSVAGKDKSVFKYAIQVASFKGLNEAKKTVARFREKGFSAYCIRAVVRGSEIWYRVRIGAYKDRIDAGKTLARLEKNNIDCFLVTR